MRAARPPRTVLTHAPAPPPPRRRAARAARVRGADRARAARSIAAAGRTALAELEELFGTPAEEPPRDLDSLVEGVRATGLHVDLHRRGNGATPPPDVELAVHRIVQEALTNAVKHSAARRVSVEVVSGLGQVEVRVEDDGTGDGGGFRVRARLSWT